MRYSYLNDLDSLKEEIIIFSIKAQNLIKKTKNVIDGEKINLKYVDEKYIEIYNLEKKIANESINLLSTQQPVARDLRFISSSIKILNYIRRISEHTLEILQILSLVDFNCFEDENIYKNLLLLREKIMFMFKESLDIFVSFDSKFNNYLVEKEKTLVYNIIKEDEVIDKLYDDYIDLIVKILKNTKGLEKNSIKLLQVSKYFERIADNIVNIVKNILFVITGEYDE